MKPLDIILIIIIAICFLLALRHIFKNGTCGCGGSGGSCSHDCAHCNCKACHKK